MTALRDSRPRLRDRPACFVKGCRDDGVAVPLRLAPEVVVVVIFCDHHRGRLEAWLHRPRAPERAPAERADPPPPPDSASPPAASGYLAACPECAGAMPEQRIGTPRRRCPECADRERRRRQHERITVVSRLILSQPPRHCVLCDRPIERQPGPRGRDKYCSPECAYEAKLRRQRHHRGGLKQPARALRMLLRSRAVVVPLPADVRSGAGVEQTDVVRVAEVV